MKLFITTAAAAALISTAAVADLSSREKAQRLDTSTTAEMTFATGPQSKALTDGSTYENDLRLDTSNRNMQDNMSMSTRSMQSPFQDYIYGGDGPGNDSR